MLGTQLTREYSITSIKHGTRVSYNHDNRNGAIRYERYLCDLTRASSGLAPLESSLPFDVEGHKAARSHVAKQMTARLTSDVAYFAARENGAITPALRTRAPLLAYSCLQTRVRSLPGTGDFRVSFPQF